MPKHPHPKLKNATRLNKYPDRKPRLLKTHFFGEKILEKYLRSPFFSNFLTKRMHLFRDLGLRIEHLFKGRGSNKLNITKTKNNSIKLLRIGRANNPNTPSHKHPQVVQEAITFCCAISNSNDTTNQ